MKIVHNIFILFCLLLWNNIAHAQRNNIWCFGDSAGIDFSIPANPVPISTSLVTRGSCVSIADTSGELLFYANTRSGAGGVITGLVWNKNHLLLNNGDSISGGGWYQEMVIVPMPDCDSLYYLFSIGVTMPNGLKFSVINMKSNGGLGTVIQKNVSLVSGTKYVDCINAVKHGNGRDWWIIVRPSPVGQPQYNNEWHLFLVSPVGISAMPGQNVGYLNGTNLGKISISPNGSKISFVNLAGLIELYSFDRCTGNISNANLVEPELTIGPYPYYWSCEYSQSGRYLYVSSQMSAVNYLWQYDTWASNIFSTKTLIWQSVSPPSYIGELKSGPDEKIYLSSSWRSPNGASNFPYDSTMYYLENMNLSVINSPDSAGTACDFQPWSFYLGGKRSYLGLPNNPDYDMPALAGSPCDTLVGINEAILQTQQSTLSVYYSPNWETAFINADKLKGNNCKLQVFDAVGKMVFEEQSKIQPPYYTKNLNCINYKKGVYLVVLQTDAERLVKKFVVE
ncbi:MAG: T9SS type A sorting domain-containing protein [Bacteroidetes bacterium]|nr:T9SS type A sorting domain-containing protein [Bacteroidota bacterium]